MASLILVPFNGGSVAQAALRAACLEARRDGSMVEALYVALAPRQSPLSADLPWLARDVARVQLLARPIIAESRADAWVEWVVARELAPAIADVARELQATRIMLGDRRAGARPAWRRRWSLPARLARLAPCPVVIHGVDALDRPSLAEPATVAPQASTRAG